VPDTAINLLQMSLEREKRAQVEQELLRLQASKTKAEAGDHSLHTRGKTAEL
jgi:hypothetical protein